MSRIRNNLYCFLILVYFFIFQSQALALVCFSPKKGAATATLNGEKANPLGIGSFYNYSPSSLNRSTYPMLKRGYIQQIDSYTQKIKQTAERFPGTYWLIFNEPFGEDEYLKRDENNALIGGGAIQATNDAAKAISFIVKFDPTAKFILGWLTENDRDPFNPSTKDLVTEWPKIAPNYNLDQDIKKVISGWHVHLYGLSVEGINDLKNHPALKKTLGKELWITEFGTLDGEACRYDQINTDPDQRCIMYLESLLYKLENSSYINKYFWWNYGPCNPDCALKPRPSWCQQYQRDMCWGPLTAKNNSGQTVLNNLGRAFAAIPNDNGICRFSANPTNSPSPTIAVATLRPTRILTPSSTPTTTILVNFKGDFNSDGQINVADYSIFVSKYNQNDSACDFNQDQQINTQDVKIFLNNYGH